MTSSGQARFVATTVGLLIGDRGFESISLQRRVWYEPDIHALEGGATQPSIGDCEYDPFLLPAVGAASCRRSSLGPPIGCFGAHFVKLGSSLRQACSSAETGTVSISPARATSISYLVGDAARLRGAIARRNFGIERNSSTRGISTRSRRRSSGKSSDRRRVFSMSWTPVPARVITSRE
jgi:hypothetical protein